MVELRTPALGTDATQSRVPSFTNFQFDSRVLSATGLYMRNARSLPSKPGSEKPELSSTLARCGMTASDLSLTIVFGSAAPLMSLAFSRLTVPMMGLPVGNSLDAAELVRSADCVKAC